MACCEPKEELRAQPRDKNKLGWPSTVKINMYYLPTSTLCICITDSYITYKGGGDLEALNVDEGRHYIYIFPFFIQSHLQSVY